MPTVEAIRLNMTICQLQQQIATLSLELYRRDLAAAEAEAARDVRQPPANGTVQS